jgi:nucleotide-binding universal stress UspA family protein
MSGHIVVGVDGTEGGRRALAWAIRYAAATGADLLVASVYFDPGHRAGRTPPSRAQWDRQDAFHHLQADLETVLAEVPDRPPIKTAVLPGDVIAHTLADLAEDADLLVVGSHGHSAASSRLLGTVSSGCVSSAVCPVVVIPAADRVKHHARKHERLAFPDPVPYY